MAGPFPHRFATRRPRSVQRFDDILAAHLNAKWDGDTQTVAVTDLDGTFLCWANVPDEIPRRDAERAIDRIRIGYLHGAHA